MRSWRPRLVALGSVLVLVVTGACAERATTNPLTDVVVAPAGGGPEPADDPASVTDAALADITTFWEQTYPEVYGEEFRHLEGGFHAYGPGTEMPRCGGRRPSYEDIAENAFYCLDSDLIAWDEARLVPWINEQFGAFTIGIVFAHEYGHAIQARAGVDGRTIDLELQADCFAGAWTAYAAAGDSPAFTIDETGLDASVAGLVAISDVPGTAASDPLAHGSGFDRIGAFQDGYENGAARCVEYPEAMLPIVEIPFDDAEEERSGGNLRLDDTGSDPEDAGLLSRLEVDLDGFYEVVLDALGHQWQPVDDLVLVDPAADAVRCGGERLTDDELRYAARYCEDENTVVVDRTGLIEDLYTIGDFAVASEIARLWALAAQDQLGLPDERATSLQADCLTGVWAFSNFPRAGFEPDHLVMSAGDLDEGIMGFLAYDVSAEDTGTVFERTDALRAGFVDGYRGCEEYAPLD